MKEHQNILNFKIAVSNPNESHFSLIKENADFSYNQIVLNAVIGTLVKYGQSGRIEPYLAESWTVSRDNKDWTFLIRNGLYAEDGSEINASLFVEVLNKSLKNYSKRGSVIMFDNLVGWSDFVAGKSDSLTGITSNGNSIKFEFSSSPDSFLEILRMPYFGLWPKDSKLISTGPYVISKFSSNEVTLKLRPDWFTATEGSVKEVKIGFTSLESSYVEAAASTITRLPFFIEPNLSLKNGFWVTSPPTRLESFTLSPTKSNFFNNAHNRKVFNERIRSQYPKSIKADYFYQSAKSSIVKSSDLDNYQNIENISLLTFALERTNYSKDELENLNILITDSLYGTDIKFKIIERDLNDKDWFKKTDSNDYFDARISSVDIGASPLKAAIKMMFCTKLGISFPDPSGGICALISKWEEDSKSIDQSFISQFNQILYDDAVVIPIFHHSDKWFVTNDIDPKSLPPTTLYPQFELIKIK